MTRKYIKIALLLLAVAGGMYNYSADKVPDTMYFCTGQDIEIRSLPIITLNPTEKHADSTYVQQSEDSMQYTASLFGIFPVKDVAVLQTETRYVNVSGKPFGIKMFCDGVMLVGFSDILTRTGYRNPAKMAGLKTGDIITHINDVAVKTNEDVENMIEKYGKNPLKISYSRNEKKHNAILMAVKDINTRTMRTGMWVRDSGAGIGTMTFFDNGIGYFAGLGHGIKDVDTQQELRLLSGEIVPVKITGIIKSKNGSAGQLKGTFTSTLASGKVLHNGTTGVYGKAYITEKDNLMPVASPAEITTGKAHLLTTINGSIPRMYEIEIEKVNLNSGDVNKNMVIRITDSRLLSLTGGIVRGFSGSPIIQNGKLAGAVTHVFVNQVEKGYGIFAQNMLETMDSIAAANGDMAA